MPPSHPPPQIQGAFSRIVPSIVLLIIGIIFTLTGGAGAYASARGNVAVVGLVGGGLFCLIGLLSSAFALRLLFRGPDASRLFESGRQQPARIEDNSHFPKASPRQGTHGVRLTAHAPPFKTALGCGCFSLIWNAFVWGIFGSLFLEGRMNGIGEFIGLTIFGGIGLLGIGYTIYQLLRAVLVGDTYVELEREPLRPGEEFKLYVHQPGDFPITSAIVQIVCEEVAKYRRGTDTITVKEEVSCTEIASMANLQASRHAPIIQVRARVPVDAMHSFMAGNNTIQWFIRVKLDIPGRPDVDDKYDFRVMPEAPRSA
jgi:hypothetical protein